MDLANEELSEAQQRFHAGVSDNLPVSQAQAETEQANDQYISALYQHNVGQAFAGACARRCVRPTRKIISEESNRGRRQVERQRPSRAEAETPETDEGVRSRRQSSAAD